MGRLGENKMPTSSTVAGVCVETVPPIAKADEFGFLAGETLAQRANRLDSELKRSIGDVGARGEPGDIEITGH